MSNKMHVGLGLKANAVGIHDVYLDNTGNLVLARKAEAVGQHVRERLMTYAHEWFLNTDIGVPWLDEIMAQQFNPGLAEAVLKGEVLDTDGVTEIVTFSVNFNKIRRDLMYRDIQVRTEYEQEVKV
jgi:hypothetical protein